LVGEEEEGVMPAARRALRAYLEMERVLLKGKLTGQVI
jgi:hypothetical protein